MNIFTSIFNALKDGASQMGEGPVDSSDITTFEKALSQAKQELAIAKQSELKISSAHTQSRAKLRQIESLIEEKKTAAIKAMDEGDQSTALNIAGGIIALEQEQESEQHNAQQFGVKLNNIKTQVGKLENQVLDMTKHLSQVKATEKVHKAQESIQSSMNAGQSSVSSARESLERIKAQQALKQAEQDVAQEVSAFMADEEHKNANLDTKIQAASAEKDNSQDAQALLDQLKSNHKEK